MKKRCAWVSDDPIYINYHDKEWGVAIYDDHLLFEYLILEGAQAGLSWITILKKRENYRKAFDKFDPKKIANYKADKIKQLLENPGIVRNRLKVAAAITNAKVFLQLQKEGIRFSDFIWQFVDGKPMHQHRKNTKQIPVRTELSNRMSKELKKRGFKFVGSSICYAFMQAVGMINDHTEDCFRYKKK